MNTPAPIPAVIALADKYQANAPHRTLAQWQAMVEGAENILSDTNEWFDEESQRSCAAVRLVRDRVALRGVQ